MTTFDPRDRAAPSDSRVDAAWRALSSEEPPKSLDAAIMAAARREVGARPQKIATPEAIADRRRWWPLAAAATVAAIAVGVLQLTTPDRIGAPASDKTIVTDVPAPAVRSAPAPATQTVPDMPTTLSRPEDTKPEAANTLRAERTPTRADSPRRQATAPEPREPLTRESAAGDAAAMAEPFPAAPRPPAVAATPAPAGSVGNTMPTAQVATSAAPNEAPQPPAVAGIAAAGRAPPSRDDVAPARTLAAPAAAPAPALPRSTQRAQERTSAQPAPLAKMAAGRAADARTDEARAKDRGPLPVVEWIALIRRLRDEGKFADAAKELAAFRVAHADHEKRLPPDLRDWRPPDKN